MAGYSGTPLPKKLGIKEGHRVAQLGGPEGFLAGLDLHPSVRVDGELEEERDYDVLLAFVPNLAGLSGLFERCMPILNWNGGLWLAWPKRSSPLASDVRESDIRGAGLEAGLVDNKICAVDDDWSGLRFVYRKEDRPK